MSGRPISSCALGAGGGWSRVHEHSVVFVEGACIVAVGDTLCSLSLPDLSVRWATQVDSATCFGVYYDARHGCLLSHGELEIARVTVEGKIVWSVGGKDIFSEGFEILGDQIEVTDFYQQRYRIDIATGHAELVPS